MRYRIGCATRRLTWLLAGLIAGCSSHREPVAPQGPERRSAIAEYTIELGRPDATLRGVAGDGALVFAELTELQTRSTPAQRSSSVPNGPTIVEAFRPGAGAAPIWHAALAGDGGPLLAASGQVIVALAGTGAVADLELAGRPGAAIAALDAATGALRWKLAVDGEAASSAAVTALAATADGVLVAGAFTGTLRIGDHVVSSTGDADGFVARITTAGEVRWLIQLGGAGPDSVTSVAAAGDRIAIGGMFAAGATLLGTPLAAFSKASLFDGFVAELDGAGRLRWVKTFGTSEDETVGGIAITARGDIAVGATLRATLHLGGADQVVRGDGEGLVTWWTPEGRDRTATLVGGSGLQLMAVAGERVVVAGFSSGALRVGRRTLPASGGYDAFITELDASGRVIESWPAGGVGGETIIGLAAIPGGFVAGVMHTTAATFGDTALPEPGPEMIGATLVVRAAR